MLLTGSMPKGLSQETSVQVLKRINAINRGGAIHKMHLDWLEDCAKNTNVIASMSGAEQNEYKAFLH